MGVTGQLVCLPQGMEAGLPTAYTPAGTPPCELNKERTSVWALGAQNRETPCNSTRVCAASAGPQPQRWPLQVWNGTDTTKLAPACPRGHSLP